MKTAIAVRASDSHAHPGDTAPYEEALKAAGVETVIVSPNAAASLDGFAGLLLMGGADVNPSLYGEERRTETDAPDDARDRLECALIAEALDRDMPILAICRGLQILNVQHGGTLIQHLDSLERHRVKPADRSLPAHSISIVPDTALAEIAAGALTWEVNSRHHQAAGRIGSGLIVSARDTEDGTVEALESRDRNFVIAVQWHPENQSPVREDQARLFRSFAAALKQQG